MFCKYADNVILKRTTVDFSCGNCKGFNLLSRKLVPGESQNCIHCLKNYTGKAMPPV